MTGLNGKRLSPSGIDRALLCAYSFTSDLPWHDAKSSSAKLGTAFHAYAEDMIAEPWSARTVGKLADEYQLAPAQRRDLDIIIRKFNTWVASEDFTGAKAEVKIAFDPELRTARVIETTGARDYSTAHDNEMVGTVDVLRINTVGVAEITDWKTGRYVDHPGESVQQRAYAVGGAFLTGAPVVASYIVRVNAQQDPIRLAATFNAPDLLAFSGQLVQLRAKIRDKGQEPHPSALACRYCPVKRTCEVAYTEKGIAA